VTTVCPTKPTPMVVSAIGRVGSWADLRRAYGDRHGYADRGRASRSRGRGIDRHVREGRYGIPRIEHSRMVRRTLTDIATIGEAFATAELWHIIALSLSVSMSAAAIAAVLGLPLGVILAIGRFRGRRTAIVAANSLLGLPPVVIGLALYLLLSHTGSLGFLGLLFTPTAMVIAQAVLAVPIVVALAHRAAERTVGRVRRCFTGLRCEQMPRDPDLTEHGAWADADGGIGRVRPDYIRGRSHSDRRRQHRRVHPHDDDRRRARNQQG